MVYDDNAVDLGLPLSVKSNTNITLNLMGGYFGPKFNLTLLARNSIGNLTTNTLNLVGIPTCPTGLYENVWDIGGDICVDCPKV